MKSHPPSHLNEDARYTLETHHKDSRRTLLVDVPIAVPNRVLGLDREQEAGHEPVDVSDAGLHGFRGIVIVNNEEAVECLQVTVCVRYQPPDQCERRPGHQEAHREHH